LIWYLCKKKGKRSYRANGVGRLAKAWIYRYSGQDRYGGILLFAALSFYNVKMEDSKRVLCFNLLDPSHPEYQAKTIYYRKKFIEKQIKNSFGDSESRFLIRTAVRIHNRKIRAWISLTDRGNMKYPMLLGSRLLRNKFIVDVSLKETKTK
jgi:hypothetical protein